ncbi:hypothetical protein Poly51_63880 [Rubripirellula tenax]|uniref:Uncharacterized protein n=1 Tax=Rubripirellula tenax TaxID=2528015 RepID=A0A5C6E1Y0_9BACT|nr:hypothetical protein Poly51_63880 [Rubripirellula tenax]
MTKIDVPKFGDKSSKVGVQGSTLCRVTVAVTEPEVTTFHREKCRKSGFACTAWFPVIYV